MPRTRLLLVTAVAGALLVPGCGADPGGTNGALGRAPDRDAGTPAASESSGSTRATESGGAPESVDPAAPGFPPQPTGRRVSRLGFASPTGNIVCQMSRTGASCVIGERDYRVPSPEGCVDGRSALFTVERRGPATFGACEGGVVVPGSSLPYGTASVVGPMTCLSRQTGMFCWSGRTGHGFRVARASYDLH